MLKDCSLGANVIVDMKNSMPSADKLGVIAQYLDVSVEYLLGLTDDPTLPKKNLTLDEEVATQYYLMTPEEKEQYKEYGEFLKTKRERKIKSTNGRTEISSELQPGL